MKAGHLLQSDAPLRCDRIGRIFALSVRGPSVEVSLKTKTVINEIRKIVRMVSSAITDFCSLFLLDACRSR